MTLYTCIDSIIYFYFSLSLSFSYLSAGARNARSRVEAFSTNLTIISSRIHKSVLLHYP